jgi:hypothetical protein
VNSTRFLHRIFETQAGGAIPAGRIRCNPDETRSTVLEDIPRYICARASSRFRSPFSPTVPRSYRCRRIGRRGDGTPSDRNTRHSPMRLDLLAALGRMSQSTASSSALIRFYDSPGRVLLGFAMRRFNKAFTTCEPPTRFSQPFRRFRWHGYERVSILFSRTSPVLAHTGLGAATTSRHSFSDHPSPCVMSPRYTAGPFRCSASVMWSSL